MCGKMECRESKEDIEGWSGTSWLALCANAVHKGAGMNYDSFERAKLIINEAVWTAAAETHARDSIIITFSALLTKAMFLK